MRVATVPCNASIPEISTGNQHANLRRVNRRAKKRWFGIAEIGIQGRRRSLYGWGYISDNYLPCSWPERAVANLARRIAACGFDSHVSNHLLVGLINQQTRASSGDSMEPKLAGLKSQQLNGEKNDR